MPNKSTPKSLIHHISRLEGQLASVKKELLSGDPDCMKTATTLRAASRSFASLRHAFVSCFLAEKFIDAKRLKPASAEEEFDALLNLVQS